MGLEKYQKKILNLFEKSPIVSFKSIENIVKERKNIRQYPKQLIKNLLMQGKIKRIGKGFYSKYEDSALFVLCLKNSYLGLQSALSYYNLWEQEAIPVIITSNNIRKGIRKINGQNVLIKKINKKYVFGFSYNKEGNFYLPYSDIEKTFIDLIYFNKSTKKLDKEVLKNFKKRIDKVKLKRYLKKYPKRFQKQILRLIE
jgi:predicted transcriptional regulator of viral defense system